MSPQTPDTDPDTSGLTTDGVSHESHPKDRHLTDPHDHEARASEGFAPEETGSHARSIQGRESHDHSHAHSHHHGLGGHSHGVATGSGTEKRLAFSVAFNLIITAAQVVGGLVSGSLALLSDALHNFSDASSLLISLVANRLSRRKPTEHMTFGFRRAEIVGAFVNLITLGIVAILILKEAIHRILTPESVDTTILLVVASIGLVANILTALLLRQDAKDSVNIKSAYLHIMMDTLSSVAVIVGAIVIRYSEWTFIDPILSVLIAGYIVYFGWNMLKSVTDILMEAVPSDLAVTEIVDEILTVRSVVDVHHVHVWMIDEKSTALEAHVSLDAQDWLQMETVKAQIKSRLVDAFGIAHSTLEFEFSEVPCPEADTPDCY